MRNSPLRPTPHSVALSVSLSQPPLPDGTYLIPLNDAFETVHSDEQPTETFDRHREAIFLDRLFWTTVGGLMVVGLGLRLWVLW